jgi:hypothetical protein
MPEAAEFLRRGLKFFSLVPMLTKAASSRQITDSRNFGNEVSEKKTGFRCQVSGVSSRCAVWRCDHGLCMEI